MTNPLRSTMKRTVASAASIALVLLGSAACGSSDDGSDENSDGLETIRVISSGSSVSLGFWVAEEQGYFEEQGLNIETTDVSTKAAGNIPSLLGKQYDIGQVNGVVLLAATGNGIDIVAVSGAAQTTTGDNTVLIGKKSGVDKPEDLVGKRIGVPSVAGSINVGTMYWLDSLGVDTDKIEVVAASPGDMPDLLKSGRVDALEALQPYSGMLIEEGFKEIANVGNTAGDPTIMGVWAASKSWAKDNGTAVKKLRAALDQASEWIKANEDQAIDLVIKKTGVDPQYKKYMTLISYDTDVKKEQLEEWKKAMEVVSGFDKKVDVDSIILESK